MDLILGIVLRKWLRLLKTALFLGQNILGDYVKLSIKQNFDIIFMVWIHEAHRK